MKKFLSLALAALCAATMLTSCAGSKAPKGTTTQAVEENPAQEVSTAFTTTVEKTLSSTPAAVLNKVSESGNVHVQAATTVQGEKISYDVWATSGKNPRAALKFNAMGIDAAMYIDTNAIVVECDKLFGNKAYGLSFKNIEKNLRSSMLPSMMGVDAETIIETAGPVIEVLENLDKYASEQAAYEETAANELYAILASEKNYTVTDETYYALADGHIDAIILDYKITPELIMEAAEAYVDMYFENPLLSNFIGLSAMAQGMSSEEMMEEMFYEALEELEYEVYYAFEEAEMEYIPISIVFNKKTGEFVYAEIKNDEGDGIYIDLGADPAKSEKWVIGFIDDGEENQLIIKKWFNGNNGEITIFANEDEIMSFVLNNGKFVYEVGEYEIMTGTCKYSANSLELTFDEVADGADLSIVIDTKQAPKAPGFKDILTMNMSDIQKLAMTIQSNGSSLSGGLMY